MLFLRYKSMVIVLLVMILAGVSTLAEKLGLLDSGTAKVRIEIQNQAFRAIN